MTKIRNDDAFVASKTLTGLTKLAGLELNAVRETGAVGVQAEDACSGTYENGKQITGVVKKFLTETYQCMKETSRFLLDTDEQAAKSTAGASSWAMKIGIK